jgi:hypothetical protein
MEQQITKMLKQFDSTHLLIKLWVDSDMEVIIDLLDLGQILILHFSSGSTLIAWIVWIWEKYLIDNNISNINFLFGKFDAKTFGLVHTKKLGNAHSYKSGFFWVLKLLIDLLNFGFHAVHCFE